MSPPLAALPPNENRGNVLNGVAIGLLVPAILIVLLRMWVRVTITENVGFDDWCMVIATPFVIADQVMPIISTQYGIGRHVYYIKPTDLTEAVKLNTIAQPLNIIGLFFVKASIVALLIRIKFPKKYNLILYITIGLLLSISLAGVIIAFAQCQPFQKNWRPDIPGTCWNRDAFADAAYILQGITIVTDLVYIIIPMFFLWNVQMKKSLKIGILGVIGIGVISMACSITAIPFVHELGTTIDATWAIVNLAAIKIGEANVAMICGCLPPLQPLFGKVNKRYFSKNTQVQETYEARLKRLNLKASEYEMLSGKTKESARSFNLTNPTTHSKTSIVTHTYAENSDASYLRDHGASHAGVGNEIV